MNWSIRKKLYLVTIFMIIVLNCNKSFCFDVKMAAKCSLSKSANVVDVINMPEKIQIIGSVFWICIVNQLIKNIGNMLGAGKAAFNALTREDRGFSNQGEIHH